MFLNAVMLAGIGGAVVPLVLHLLNRYRFRTVQWGAMMFLLGDDPRQTRHNRLKQILLLLIRMALVAALAICLARPVIYAHWAPATTTPASVVILLDRSPAMAFPENRQPRLSQAKTAIASILSSLHSGDEVTLLTLGDAPGAPAPAPTTDLPALADRVQFLSTGPSLSNIADGLNRAAEIFSASDRPNRRLFIVCGRQATAWKQVDSAFCQTWTQRWPASAPTITVVTVGSPDFDNIAVTAMRLLHPPILRNRPGDIQATIHNYGQSAHSHILINFKVAGKSVASAPLSVGPGGEAIARQSVSFPDAGSHVLVAQVPGPPMGIPTDDSNQLAVDVLDSLPVLILSAPPAHGTIPDSSFISLALAPFHGAGRQGPDLAIATVIDPADPAWPDSLSSYCVVILSDVPLLTPTQVQSLEAFVYNGGGLLIAPGPRVRAADYNDALYKDGAGLMPALLQPPTPADGSAATTLAKLDRAHPVFDFLRDKPEFTPSPVIRRYFPALPASSAQTLATFTGGQPFLISSAFGKGRVLLATTPLDENWGTLPLDSFFLPFVQSATAFLAAQPSSHNLDLGQPIVVSFDQPVDAKTARLTRPAGEPPIELSPQRTGDKTEFRYMPDRSGEYDFTVHIATADHQEHFAVRRPPGVSDLTPLTPDQWTQLTRQLNFTLIDAAHDDLSQSIGAGPEQRELWSWLLALVFTLAVIEVGLERLWTSA